MKTKYDLSKADAVIDEYLQELKDPRKIPGALGRTWLEFCMERNGMIADARGLSLGESHALWYASLVVTKRLREVTRAEREAMPQRASSTETTVRKCLNPRSFIFNNHIARLLREILENESVTV